MRPLRRMALPLRTQMMTSCVLTHGKPRALPLPCRAALLLCPTKRCLRTKKGESRARSEGGGGRGGDIRSLCAAFCLTNCELAVLDRLPGASGEI